MIKYIYRKYISLISKFYKNNIDGWTTEDELIWLLRTASSMDNVLEIGYWKGRSTHALATGCYGTVCTVDHFMGNVDERDNAHKEVKERQIFYDAKHNLKHFRNLVIINSYSFDASLLFKDKSIDMIFIDGCHSLLSFSRDLDWWLPKCKKVICGHDYCGEVKFVVDKRFKNNVENPVDGIWRVNI